MTLKKAELHVHLEGTIPPDLAFKLAKRNHLSIPDGLIANDGKSYLSNDFLHFLSVYDTLAALIKAPIDYYDITFDYLKNRAAHGGIYVEMMYSPDHAEQSSNIPSKEHLSAIEQAIIDAKKQFNIVGRIIITAVRHFGHESAERVAMEAAKHPFKCATGFGLGGDEAGFPPAQFKKAYEIARDAGLMCTVHAGEFAGPEGMQEAMKHLPIQRIGHGVRSIECAKTRDMVKDLDIALELCPTSNVFLGLYPNIDMHPFKQLLEDGIKVSINSDDPPFMSTTLEHEYDLVQKHFGFNDEKMNDITLMALDAAFVDDKTREALKQRVRSGV